MEEELKCPVCKRIYNNPVLLPCLHSMCLNCGVHIQQPAQQVLSGNEDAQTVISEGSYEGSTGDSPNVDTLSIVSETDSGVVVNSRPNSYVGTPNIHGMIFPPLPANSLAVTCPVCHKTVYFDENGVQNLPKSRALQSIIDRYRESKNLVVKCQLCEGEPADASLMCEQCEVFYCAPCKDNCHPARGPLAAHTLLNPTQGREKLKSKNKVRDARCAEHADEHLSMYCMLCKMPVCYLCLQDGRHNSHDVQALGAMGKAQKSSPSFGSVYCDVMQRAPYENILKLSGLPVVSLSPEAGFVTAQIKL
ncbi:PREDICTED: E3 ubiquitin-protein ligase TRIM9-like, partial [Priapulus caudatus]|uniref:E3 ubiquitin-protein ligase TRIM9-like n=1 Tax=Priapulus caudatus TaxID=37621 RepID=A0ABM1EAA1_PRICU